MSLEMQHECPNCEDEQTFWRSASTNLHLGEKTKWHCSECDFALVRINGDIDSASA